MSGKKRVLITGATGFVGKHLRAAFEHGGERSGAGAIDTEFEVFGTAFPDPPPPASDRLFCADMRSEADVLKVVREAKPDWVFHLAAVSSVRESWGMRRETLETNVLGTHNLLEAVRREAPGARVLFVSSADVYGQSASPDELLTEESPVSPASPYAYSKAAGESMCGYFGRAEGLDIVVARTFPHTGPGQSPVFVCPDWARQAARIERGEAAPVIRVGNLEVRRDLSDVRDVVEAYVLLLEKGRKGEVYNVCSGRSWTLKEVLEILLRAAGAGGGATPVTGGAVPISVEVDPAKLRGRDVPWLNGSNRKIAQVTGWAPRIPLERTLADLLDYWRGR